MILKAIGWLITIGIPALIFFDMFDNTALLFFGAYYGFALFIQTIAMGVFIFASGNEDMKLIVKAKLEEEHSKDSALFQYLLATICEVFVIFMLWSVAPFITVILGVKVILGIINLLFLDKIYKTEAKTKDTPE